MAVRWSVVALAVVVSASAQTDSGNDALFVALQHARGAAPEVAALLRGGVSANAADAEGMPALMTATLFGNEELMKLLLDRGADPNKVDRAGVSALMLAVPDVEKVRLLLARGANVNARSSTDRTPLLVAAAFPGTSEVIRLLLENGADIRARDRAGATALALATRSADVDVVRLLVEKGLDPAELPPGAKRAAITRYDSATTDYLMSKALSPAQTPDLLVAAAIWQPSDHLARWIDLGADVNASVGAQYGRTALMSAVTSELASADILKLLLDRGADPNARMAEGETPLDWATYKGDKAKIAVLEQRGAVRGNGPRREDIAPPAKGGITDPRVSLTRSVARVLDVAPKFREQATCISCHHNAMPAYAAATARQKGIEIDRAKESKNVDDMVTFFKAAIPRMAQGDPAVGGEALTTGYVQLALKAGNHPLDTVTATMTHWLLARQMPDGRWLGNGLNRPPSEYSTISHTAIASGGLAAYPLPGRAGQIAESKRRAQQWLLAAQPASAEERAMRLMGLVWTAAPRGRIDEAVRDVRAQQDVSGGWSQFGRTAPDAYATGLSLHALHIAGVRATDPTYRKGIAYLLGSQYQDGTWLVKTHSFPVQRYFESGFPYGRHQWISTAGTSWASLAIAHTLEDRK
jgi:ankyrin repeat protein